MNPSVEKSPNMPLPAISPQEFAEVNADNLSAAEQVGLIDGQFDVLRSDKSVDRGWTVIGVGSDTDRDTGLQRQYIEIEKPKLDNDGNQLLDEDGAPLVEFKSIWTDKLMSWQPTDSADNEDTREAQLALEEVGGVAVNATTELDELEITETVDSEQVSIEETALESPAENPIVEESSEAAIEPAKGPATEELQKISDAFIDTAKNFEGVHNTVESLPDTVGRLTDAFTQTQGQYLDQVGSSLANVKSLVEPLRNMAPLLRTLEQDVHGSIDQRTRQELQNAVENAHQALRGLGELAGVVGDGKRAVDGTQRSLADQITHIARQAEATVDTFASEANKHIDNGIYEGHQKVSEAVMVDAGDETGVLVRDRDKLDHFDHDLNKITNYSRNLQEATLSLGNTAARQMDYDLTGTILNTHGLNPMSIDEAYASMGSFVRVLEAVASHSNGTKGNALAELQPTVNTRLREAIEIVERMRRPTTEFAEQSTSFSKLKNQAKDALGQSDILASYLRSVRREIEDGARA